MKYELIETKNVGFDKIYKVKCIPSKIGKFFRVKEKIETLIYKGSTYNMSGHKVFYDLQGDKVLNSVSEWLNSKLHYEYYTVEEKKKDRITFTTTLIPLNMKNLNGHIYLDNENLRQSIDDINNRVKTLGVVYGEYNYPINFDTNLSRVSHTIKNVRIEDDKVIGDITILEGPTLQYGNKLKENYKNMVFRPRSVGVVEESGLVVIKKLFTFDAVEGDTDAFIDANNIEKTPDEKYSDFLANKIEETKNE